MGLFRKGIIYWIAVKLHRLQYTVFLNVKMKMFATIYTLFILSAVLWLKYVWNIVSSKEMTLNQHIIAYS